MTGKAFITMAYSIAYLYGSEIFPTEVRNVGVGVASLTENLGKFMAPLIAGPLVLPRNTCSIIIAIMLNEFSSLAQFLMSF